MKNIWSSFKHWLIHQYRRIIWWPETPSIWRKRWTWREVIQRDDRMLIGIRSDGATFYTLVGPSLETARAELHCYLFCSCSTTFECEVHRYLKANRLI